MNSILVLIAVIVLACSSPDSRDKKQTNGDSVKVFTDECSDLYLFDGSYISLEENILIKMTETPKTDFTKCSKFAHRFENPISDTVEANGFMYCLENNKDKKKYKMHIYKDGKLTKTVDLPVENPLPEVHEYYIHLLPYKNDVIMFMEDMYTTHYFVCKYNSDGDLLLRKDIEHTYITHPNSNENHYNRYLYYFGLTSNQMIFTSHIAFADKFKTILLSMDDFAITEYDKTAHGVILDENEEKLIGFVNEDEGHFTVYMTDNSKYEFDIKYGNPGCDFILKDSLLYIANYHPIATGSSLHCFDFKTKKMKWTADVLQVNASHSEYWNKVTLSIYKSKIIMQGDEASGSYLQIFDAESGKRLAHFGNVGLGME